MENFFNSPKNRETTPLNSQYDNLKENYHQIFIEAAESIRREIDKFKPENPCATCIIKECRKLVFYRISTYVHTGKKNENPGKQREIIHR